MSPFTCLAQSPNGGDQIYIGLDIHKNFCHATVLDNKGKVIHTGSVENNIGKIRDFIKSLGKGEKHAVIEASSTWTYIYDILEELGVDVILAHPLKLRYIAEARIKTDKIDSKILAQLLRTDMIPKSWVAPKRIRELRNITRHRASLVKMRTQVKNEIHAFLEKKGIKAKEFSDIFGKKGMEFLESLELNSTDSAILSSQLEVLKILNREIDKVTNYTGCIVKRNREARLLMTVPGISYYAALLIVSEIGDINRFSNPKKLCSWAGLVPSVHNSGKTQRHGRITKQGSKWLRWILV